MPVIIPAVPRSFTATSRPLSGSRKYATADSSAVGPGSGGVAHRIPVDLLGKALRVVPRTSALAAACSLVWLLVDPRTPDLAGALYRVELFKRFGFAIWDEHWYAGHLLPGYSLLFTPLAALVGLRALAVISAVASAALFERLVLRAYGSRARWGAAWFSLAAVADIWIGRLAFALGVTLALGAVLALANARRVAAPVLAACSAAASPVAGALLVLVALTDAATRRSTRALSALAAPAVLVLGSLAALFPEGGSEPYPLLSFAATAAVVLAFLAVLPREHPHGHRHAQLRAGALIYLGACLICLLVPTPMGSNIERYGVLLAGPLLVCALLCSDEPAHSALSCMGSSRALLGHARSKWLASAAALSACALWVAWGPVRETRAVDGDPSTSAAYYAPVERFVQELGPAPVRVEVPLTRTHWEAALLAGKVSLARGWEKQLDTRFDSALLARGLSASSYLHWLREQAVAYVALPDTPLDPSSAQEGRLIRAGLPYLREVLSSRHWRIYALASPTPLLSGPARLLSLGHEGFSLRASAPSRLLVRVRYNRYLAVLGGAGCVRRAPGGWTVVDAKRAGTLSVAARFSLGRALGLDSGCS